MSKKTQQLADELTREITSDIQPVMVNGFETDEFVNAGMDELEAEGEL